MKAHEQLQPELAETQLSQAQKDLIEALIENNLILSPDRNVLKTEICNLDFALRFNPTENNPFYKIKDFFDRPQHCLQRLENTNHHPVSVGAVQTYLIDYLTKKIRFLANEKKISLKKLNWDSEKIKKTIPNENFDCTFQSASTYVAPAPWEIEIDEEKIYTAKIRFIKEPLPRFEHAFTISYPDESSDTLTFYKYQWNFFRKTDSAETEIDFNRVVMWAKNLSERKAREYVLKYLWEKEIISIFEKNKLYHSANIELIFHKFYLDLFSQKKIPTDVLLKLTEEQISLLFTPQAINLLKAELCDVASLIQIPLHQIEIISLYKDLLEEPSEFNEIANISEEQAKNLKHPIIKKLILQKQLPLNDAKNLPAYLRPVLVFYEKYFSNNAINWEKVKVLTEENCQLLTDTKNLEHLRTQNFALLKIILSHPYLKDWIKAEIIETNELKIDDIANLHVQIYARRLFAVAINNPYTIHKKADSIECIEQELDAAANDCEITRTDLTNRILKRALYKIHSRIEHSSNYNNDRIKLMLQEMSKIKKSAKTNPPDWKKELDELTQLINDKKRKKPLNDSASYHEETNLFQPNKKLKTDDFTKSFENRK